MTKFSYLNPVKFHRETPENIPKYMSRNFEKYANAQTIKEWVAQVDYGQIWQKTDKIITTAVSDYVPGLDEFGDPIIDFFQIKLLDETGKVVYNDTLNQILQNVDNPDEWFYKSETNLPDIDIPDGIYYFKIILGDLTLISEPQCICETVPDSLLLEFRHREFKADVFFETGITFQERVLASLKYKAPASNDTFYSDQENDLALLHSDGYDIEAVVIGGSWGVPDYLIKRLNRKLGCSYTAWDGIQYTKNEGAKFEPKEIENYPLKGWSLEVRETVHTDSQVYED